MKRPLRNDNSENGKVIKTRLRMATAGDNAEILTEIRDIVKGQLVRLKADGATGSFTAAQAGILHRLAQTYAILDAHTEKEHRKYDFTGATNEEVLRLEASARGMLGDGNGE